MPNTDKKQMSKEARKTMWRYIWTFQWSWNYERMQALGYAWSMFPILEKVKKSKDELIAAMQRHLNFFNTQPHVGAAIIGATAAMEEEGADEDAVDSLKVGLMGPFAGIGDTLYAILTRPIVGVFAAGLALKGSMVGFWLMLAFGLFWGFGVHIGMFRLGYRQGINVVSGLSGEGFISRLTDMATIAGITIIGGFIPSILGLGTSLEFTRPVTVDGVTESVVVRLQDVLDQILPYAIPIALVGLAYWLLRSRRWKPIPVLLLLVAIAFVGSAIGFF